MIKGKVTYKPALKYLRKIEKQSRYANAVALTKTAWDVRAEEMEALDRYLQKPTPFTKRAFRVQRATKRRPMSSVYAAPIQEQYLQHQVYGGVSKGHVPGKKQKLNAYGNLPRRATKRKNTFSATIGGVSGVWQRKGRGKNKRVELVAHFPKSRKYSKRLPFHRVARAAVNKKFPVHYRQEFKRAMRSAR